MKKTRVRVASERHKQVAAAIQSGQPIQTAMLAAGYSKNVAAQGRAGLPKTVVALLPKRGKELIDLGKSVSLQDQTHLLVGRLVTNVIDGTDKGFQSAKTLGSRREINLFTPDVQTGVVIIGEIRTDQDKAKILEAAEE